MRPHPSLEELWNASEPPRFPFQPDLLTALPPAAQRYLVHAIAPGTPLASAVRLKMRGEMKLGRWFPFQAEQVIRAGEEMVWSAEVRMFGLPVRGYDRLLRGQGEMRWRMLGILPLVSASGPDITRSAAGRLAAESVWLPSALCSPAVSWTASRPLQALFR